MKGPGSWLVSMIKRSQVRILLEEEFRLWLYGGSLPSLPLSPLTLVLLNPDISCFANSVDLDQLASEEANWSGSALFAIKSVNLL